jgi:hypothetical protein
MAYYFLTFPIVRIDLSTAVEYCVAPRQQVKHALFNQVEMMAEARAAVRR